MQLAQLRVSDVRIAPVVVGSNSLIYKPLCDNGLKEYVTEKRRWCQRKKYKT